MSDKKQAQAPVEIQSRSLSYSGPLPTASEFTAYEKALPGAADRILKLAEKEAEHRHKNEEKIIEESIKLEHKGQKIAFIIALASIAIVLVSVLFSKPLAAIAPAILAFTSLAALFIGRNQK